MKKRRIFSTITCAALAFNMLSGIAAFAEDTSSEPTVVASDKSTSWMMSWGWERCEAGFMHHSQISTEDGLSIFLDRAKFGAVNAVAFPSKDKGLTQCEKSGEYQYYFRVNSYGELVPYDAEDTTSENVYWYWQGRHNYDARFTVSETANDGRPLVISYDYYIESNKSDQWNAPKLAVGSDKWFELYKNNSQKSYVLRYNDGTDAKAKAIVQEDTADGWHNVKIALSPEVTDGRIEMTAISLDGKAEKLEGVYSLVNSKTDADIKLDRLTASLGFEGSSSGDDTMKYKNLTVTRGVGAMNISSAVADNSSNVDPKNIPILFSEPAVLQDGAIKVYQGGTELASSDYTVTQSEDKKTAYVTLNNYNALTGYRIAVDNTLVNGVFGETAAEAFSLSFVTAKAYVEYDGSQNIVNSETKYSVVGGADGQYFTTVDNQNGVVTVTVDNQAWADALNVTKDGKTGWIDKDGDGEYDTIIGNAAAGYGSNWNYAGVNVSAAETENNGLPIYVSFDYELDNYCSAEWRLNGNGGLFNNISFGGDAPNLVYSTNGSSWNYQRMATGIEAGTVHHVEYAIDPHFVKNENASSESKSGAALITMYGIDGNIVNNASLCTIVTKAANADGSYDSSSLYVKNPQIQIGRNTTRKDENGKYLPTVLKLSNIKILRAEPLEAVINNTVATSANPTVRVNFSDPVRETELAKLKVYKGVEEVSGAISGCTLSEDGMSADISLNLSQTARYSLDVSEIEDIYTVKSSVNALGFEFYNSTDGVVWISNAAKSVSGTDAVIDVIVTSTKDAAVSPVVIAAAYASDNSLIGMNVKTITAASGTDTADSITIAGAAQAASYQVMAWDSLTNMKPYCMAFDIK